MDSDGVRKSYNKLRRRLRRSLYYGSSRMDRLSIPLTDITVEYFDQNCPFGSISPDYVSKISTDGGISPVTLIVALVYLERLRLSSKQIFEDADPEDLVNSALLCASKFLFDEGEREFLYNNDWAASCSCSLVHINEQELKFLHDIDWNLVVQRDEFLRLCSDVEYKLAAKQTRFRSFFTYSELEVLSRFTNFVVLWQQVIKPLVVSIGMLSCFYLACLSSLRMVPSSSQSAIVGRKAFCMLHVVDLDAVRPSTSGLGNLTFDQWQAVAELEPKPTVSSCRPVSDANPTALSSIHNRTFVSRPTCARCLEEDHLSATTDFTAFHQFMCITLISAL